MNLPFHTLHTIADPGTPVIKKFTDFTDNLLIADLIANGGLTGGSSTLKLASIGFSIPTTPFYLTSYLVTATAQCVVELGVVNAAGSTFRPLIITHATAGSTGGGVIRMVDSGGAVFVHDNSAWFGAVRVTGAAAGDIHVSGDLGIFTQG
jgi:hypothetical protein